MVDLKNKELLKIMWLPGEDEFVFDIKNETSIPITSQIYNHLSNYIDIDNWKNSYYQKYKNWLNEDDSSIYNIHDEINESMIHAIIKTNDNLHDKIIFYWFDIDRTDTEDFFWECCPISKEKLISLGNNFPKINSFISPVYPLIFPL